MLFAPDLKAVAGVFTLWQRTKLNIATLWYEGYPQVYPVMKCIGGHSVKYAAIGCVEKANGAS
jgi:hypothetical protein